MVINGTPSQVRLGAGSLYVAALGSYEPPSHVAPWLGWESVGLTMDGSVLNYAVSAVTVPLAASYDSMVLVSERTITMTFVMAEAGFRSLRLALGAGFLGVTVPDPYLLPSVDTIAGGDDYGMSWRLEPPAIGLESHIMLGWDSVEGDRRFLLRRCVQTGAVSLEAKRGGVMGVSAVFSVEDPGNGKQPIRLFGDKTTNVAPAAIVRTAPLDTSPALHTAPDLAPR